MLDTIVVCGRDFTPELLTHLQQLAQQQPPPSGNRMAREACSALAWFSPDGRPALSSAKVALRKLHKRGLLTLPACKSPQRGRPHRLRASGQPLPPLKAVPTRVDQVRHLQLHLISGDKDPLHGVWNDLIVAQHPCGDAPLVGAQLRYLIGSDHGWLGALGFGPGAFVLNCRDVWIGWSTPARLGHLPEVVGLSRVLIRQEVSCRNLLSRVLSLALDRVAEDCSGKEVLAAYRVEIDEMKQRGGYVTADVMDVNAQTPNLEAMLARFDKEHTHSEDEVRFILAGRGIFFLVLDESVVSVEVHPGDMLRVPRGTRHWFTLCEDRRIRAIRWFQDTTGWTPHYTGSGIDQGYQPVCFGPAYLGSRATTGLNI